MRGESQERAQLNHVYFRLPSPACHGSVCQCVCVKRACDAFDSEEEVSGMARESEM